MAGGREAGRTLAPHLRKRFAARLPQQVDTMETALTAVFSDPGNKEALESLHVVVHKLAGSAAFFGFPGISTAALDLENRLYLLLEGEAPDPILGFLENEIRPAFEALKLSVTASVDG